jgi:hypothetical protein
MLINCTTKGCLKATEAKLNRETGEVICEDCGNPIQNITPYMKKSLDSVGQVLRSVSKQAFQATCQNCNASRPLYVHENKAYCSKCSSQVPVTPAFLKGLKQYLKNKED